MAGSWTTVSVYKGSIDGSVRTSRGFEYEFTADASDASVPDKSTTPLGGALAGVAVIFDATTPPDTVTVTVNDQLGATVATGTKTATGYIDMLDGPVVFIPGSLTISISGNTTNSAVAKIVLIVI